MGWGMIAAPGTEVGPCKEKCQHTDCAATREMAESLCIHCKKPIGYETKMYHIKDNMYAHTLCVWEKEEQRQKRTKRIKKRIENLY